MRFRACERTPRALLVRQTQSRGAHTCPQQPGASRSSSPPRVRKFGANDAAHASAAHSRVGINREHTSPKASRKCRNQRTYAARIPALHRPPTHTLSRRRPTAPRLRAGIDRATYAPSVACEGPQRRFTAVSIPTVNIQPLATAARRTPPHLDREWASKTRYSRRAPHLARHPGAAPYSAFPPWNVGHSHAPPRGSRRRRRPPLCSTGRRALPCAPAVGTRRAREMHRSVVARVSRATFHAAHVSTSQLRAGINQRACAPSVVSRRPPRRFAAVSIPTLNFPPRWLRLGALCFTSIESGNRRCATLGTRPTSQAALTQRRTPHSRPGTCAKNTHERAQ